MSISGDEERSKRINRRTGHDFTFTRSSDNCNDLALDYEIRAANSGVKLGHGSFKFTAALEASAESESSQQCTLAVNKPSRQIYDYNYMLVYKKLSAAKGRLTYQARPGE